METVVLWLRGLVAAFVTGAATALTATQGCDVISSPLNWHQISAVGLAAGFFGSLAYLKSSPVPDFPTQKTPTTLTPGPIRAEDLTDK